MKKVFVRTRKLRINNKHFTQPLSCSDSFMLFIHPYKLCHLITIPSKTVGCGIAPGNLVSYCGPATIMCVVGSLGKHLQKYRNTEIVKNPGIYQNTTQLFMVSLFSQRKDEASDGNTYQGKVKTFCYYVSYHSSPNYDLIKFIK